jgi:Na+-transporting NADH:ubiquinone oxidoreductase subunit NqrB
MGDIKTLLVFVVIKLLPSIFLNVQNSFQSKWTDMCKRQYLNENEYIVCSAIRDRVFSKSTSLRYNADKFQKLHYN